MYMRAQIYVYMCIDKCPQELAVFQVSQDGVVRLPKPSVQASSASAAPPQSARAKPDSQDQPRRVCFCTCLLMIINTIVRIS